MGQRQTYTIVAGDGDRGPLDAEVHIRAYADVKCECCGARVNELSGYNARMDAAYNDGLALGEMLRKHGAGEFERGLLVGLGLRPR